MMMSFLYRICETYLGKKRKRGTWKSVNQYWRDFKMLYRRVNGAYVDANDSDEVVNVCITLLYRFSSHHTLALWVKYINGELKDKFELDTKSKPKPVTGSDDLLLLLTQHWARDVLLFPS
jgi:hypothetical protein